jgi:Uma2 family endonuclease
MNYPLMRPQRLTVEEFREIELNAPAEERWELIDGVIYKSMAGGTLRHNMIVQNVSTFVRGELRKRGSGCRSYTENVRLDAGASYLSTLPDVVVSCDPPRGDATTLNDATAVFEVHSTASRERDKSTKLEAYMQLPSVQTIVLIEQVAMSVVTFTKSGTKWVRDELREPTDAIHLEGLEIALPLSAVYEDVDFDV